MKITKTVVDRADIPTSGQRFLRDSVLLGFALRVTASGAKSFIIEKRISGRVRRITLGRYPALTVEQARRQAHKLLGEIATGHDPITKQREDQARSVSLSQVFEGYLQERNSLKLRTRSEYTRAMNSYLGDWLSKPLADITKDMVVKRHRRIGEKHGHAPANMTMRVLRAIFNFAAEKYEDSQGRSFFPENPVSRLSRTRAWFRIERRRNYIKPHELASWWNAVHELEPTLRDYFLLLLLTGLRRSEAARLTWNDIDIRGRTLIIEDTKNREPHILPLSDFLQNMLERRYQQAGESPYVFPGKHGGPLIEPKRQIKKAVTLSGVQFCLHDLRRTFGARIARTAGLQVASRLLRHKDIKVTEAVYAPIDETVLREALRGAGEVVSFPSTQAAKDVGEN